MALYKDSLQEGRNGPLQEYICVIILNRNMYFWQQIKYDVAI